MTRSAGLYNYSSPVMRAFVGAADIDGEDMTVVLVEGCAPFTLLQPPVSQPLLLTGKLWSKRCVIKWWSKRGPVWLRHGSWQGESRGHGGTLGMNENGKDTMNGGRRSGRRSGWGAKPTLDEIKSMFTLPVKGLDIHF